MVIIFYQLFEAFLEGRLICCFKHFLGWLEDAAYFAAIDNTLNTMSWYSWPEPLKNRHLAALEEIYQSKRDFVRYEYLIACSLKVLESGLI